MPVSVRTLSQLPSVPANQLMPSSKMEVAVPAEVSVDNSSTRLYKYVSRSVSIEDLSEKMVSAIRHDFADKNGFSQDFSFSELSNTVFSMASADYSFDGVKTFAKNPKIDNSSISSYSLTNTAYDDYSVNFGTLKKYANVNSAPSIGPQFGFVTCLSSNSNASERYLNIFKPGTSNGTFSNQPNFLFDENAKNVVPNEFVFRIEPGKRESDPWTAPASGIFTCYGWLDEMNNPAQANDSRWVALMGRQAQLDRWTILQIQPFAKNNYLSYVGFTFPVKKGMMLKIVTGFAVGSNSDKYFASNSSIANHVGNAFLGGIYTGLSADNGLGNDYRYETLSNDYATSSDLEALSTEILAHEAECDLSVGDYLSALSAKIDELTSSGGEGEIYDDTTIKQELSARVKYIDPGKLSGDRPINYAVIRFGNGSSYGVNNSNVKQESCINGVLSSYQCRSISFNQAADGDAFSYQNYYVPPEIAEVRDGRVGIIESAYYPETLPAGEVASDGQYFYYKTTQNCTVLIRFCDVISPVRSITVGWMLYDTNRGYSNIKALPILEKVECAKTNGYPPESITLPVKKGTILMFGIYGRQKLSKNIPWYLDALQPPVVWEDDDLGICSLNELKTDGNLSAHGYLYFNENGRMDQKRTATLILPDGSNLADTDNRLCMPKDLNTNVDRFYNLEDFLFGNVCKIYELP